MKITKLMATGLVAVMIFATATGCGKETSNDSGVIPSPTVEESHAAVADLATLESSNITSMKWSWYEDAAKKLENYSFTDYKTLKYADEYTKDRVVFTAASAQLKEDLSDYEQYYQVSKIAAISTLNDVNTLKNYGITAKNIFADSYYNNDSIKSVCEVYPIDYSTENNRLIYFAGVELTDGTVSEMIGSLQFMYDYTKTKTGETEAEPAGGKIWEIYYYGTSDNDLVTQKLTARSYNKDALNNSEVVGFDGSLIAR